MRNTIVAACVTAAAIATTLGLALVMIGEPVAAGVIFITDAVLLLGAMVADAWRLR